MNRVQKSIAIFAALILLMIAWVEGVVGVIDYNPWLALVCFMLAVGLLIYTFRSASKGD